MKKLRFVYKTSQTFSDEIVTHYFTLRCLPRDDARQKTMALNYRIWPEAGIVTSHDNYGNILQKGEIPYPHTEFGFEVSGIVQVDHSRKRTGWEPLYMYSSVYTTAQSAIWTYYHAHRPPAHGDALQRGIWMMNQLYQDFQYVQGVTDVHTTADQAMALGKGVCQDYAHILITLCHLDGIGARYVAGFMIGEGVTHAWVEMMCDGCWYGLDPTNNLIVDETYIKLSHGRDYSDCAVIRGSFYGYVKQTQIISVKVEEVL